VPVLGLATALWHALVVCALVILLIDASALTVRHMPFTRAYEPGHARLRTRWFWYATGLFLFAYFPARLELLFLHQPADWLAVLACLFICLGLMELIGRRATADSSVEADDEADEGDMSITVLDIAGVMR
jgi:cell division protein FtsW (lipid II flippase)